jgi:putative transcriptional regulator
MSETSESDSLTAKFLIAMPGMQDPRFAHALVLMCEHSPKGAMGLIINKPIPALSVSEVLKPMGLGPDCGALSHTPYFGGPVESGRGFVLHSPDYQASAGTHAIHDFAAMTTTPEILVDLSQNKGPEKAILALGYSGWGPGQIEAEILQNGWLTVDALPRIIFDMPDEKKWEAALGLLGISPLHLSSTAGRA